MNENTNVTNSPKLLEEFTLPSGKKAKRFYFSGRQYMRLQTEIQAHGDLKQEDVLLLMVCKCITIDDNHPTIEDFDIIGGIDGFDTAMLLQKVTGGSEETAKINPT